MRTIGRVARAALLAAATLAGIAMAAVPGIPTRVIAIPGDARATVHLTPPASDGGSPITSYTVTASPGGATASAPAWPIVVTGLANGTLYTFTAKANNASGASVASTPSNSVIPILPTITPAVGSQESFSLALDAHGQVYAWGSDARGSLGQGRQLIQTTPVRVNGLPPIAQISLFDQVLAVDTTGQVWSWGDNCAGTLGPRESGVTTAPARVIGATGMTQVAAGYCVSFALKSDGTVWTISSNGVQQIAGLSGISDISSGGYHLLARKGVDGTVWAYGPNTSGELGQGHTNPVSGAVQVQGLTGVTKISAGMQSSLVLLAGGQMKFWGQIKFGDPFITSPTAVTGLPGSGIAIAISSSGSGFAAVRDDGTVWQWTETLTAPNQIFGMGNAASVEACTNQNTFFSFSAASPLLGYGYNYNGQLGQGNTSLFSPSVAVPGFASGTKQVRVGFFSPAVVALKDDGSIWFWGQNTAGQIGDGAPIGSSVPLAVPIPATIKAIAPADRFALALDTGGQVWAWGDNFSANYSADQVSRSAPVAVAGMNNVALIAAGGLGSLVYTKNDGTAWWWQGQVTLSSIVGVAAASSAYFLRNDGKVFAVGGNEAGQLGDGTTVDHNDGANPAQVAITGTVLKVVASDRHSAALMSDGRVYRWGEALGASLTGGTNIPVLVPGITDAVDITVSGSGGLARRAGGGILGWGATYLADAPSFNPTNAFPVTFAQPVQAFALGSGLGYLISSTGLLWGWGNSSPSQLHSTVGDGTYVTRSSPVVIFAHAGSGSLDANNWFLDLQPATPETIPAAAIPTALATSSLFGTELGLGFDGSVKYRSADLGKHVNNYVLALVPPEFFDQVKSAPGADSKAVRKAKAAKAGGFVLAQLTPAGWTDVNGQLIAYSQGTANAAGGASSILNGINSTLVPGARFCVGYGETGSAMLNSQSLREVLLLPGASATASGVPCVLSGVYVNGPSTSVQGSPVTFAASVVGLSPTGSVQFRDTLSGSTTNMGTPLALAASNAAVANAAITTSSLAVGAHSISAAYSGDAQNAAAGTDIPKLHTVSAPLAQTQVVLDAPASATLGSQVTLVATLTGNAPTGTMQFSSDGTPLDVPATVVDGSATLRTSALAAGSHSLTASYSGDGQNTAGTSAARTILVVNVLPTHVALASNTNPAAFGATVTITVTVTGNTATPTGTVTLREEGNVRSSTSLAGGTATFTLNSLAGGVHRFTVDYSGDGSNTAASSSALFQQVAAAPVYFPAIVSRTGGGSGTVTSNPAGINCGATCNANYLSTTSLTLTAAPAGGSVFVGWSGDCAGSGDCTIGMGAPRNATARFEVAGSGVTLAPAALAFGGQSINTTAPTQTVTLTNSGAPITVTSIVAPAGFGTSSGCAVVNPGESCPVSVSFTPNVEGNYTANVGVIYTQGAGTFSVLLPVTGTGEKTLTTHYYRSILRRAPDAPGKAFWDSEAARMQSIGANLNEAWFAMAQFFYFSAEYATFNRDDTAFVTDLYTTFFNRAPDGGGLGFWVANLQQGMPREVLLASFMFSAEFANFTQAIFGNTAARAEVDVVMDFYRGLLARLPDPGGFTAWVNNFRAAQCQGGGAVNAMIESISTGFAGSGEYAGRNRTNAQYVGDLYNSFLRRGGDLGGVQYWINQVATSTLTREQVRQQFIASSEFQGRVAAIVNQGCLP